MWASGGSLYPRITAESGQFWMRANTKTGRSASTVAELGIGYDAPGCSQAMQAMVEREGRRQLAYWVQLTMPISAASAGVGHVVAVPTGSRRSWPPCSAPRRAIRK